MHTVTECRPTSRADPASRVRGGIFQYYLVVEFDYGFTTVREMKYTSQHCCDKTLDGKLALNPRILYSELQKIMVSRVTFVGFRGVAPFGIAWIPPCLQGSVL